MTDLASALAGRAIPAVRPETRSGNSRIRRRRTDESGTLAAVPVGATVVVVGIDATLAAPAARRLMDLGFVPGASVQVLRRAPLGDPTCFRVADTEIALRRRHAAAILSAPVLDH